MIEISSAVRGSAILKNDKRIVACSEVCSVATKLAALQNNLNRGKYIDLVFTACIPCLRRLRFISGRDDVIMTHINRFNENLQQLNWPNAFFVA